MSTLLKAAQQALDVLETTISSHGDIARSAINALRAALEQPEQEPVAWMYVGLRSNNNMHGPHLVWKPEHMDAMSAEKGVVASPLYTHSPRREWRGLTDAERAAVQYESFKRGLSPLEFMELHEAALKERNA